MSKLHFEQSQPIAPKTWSQPEGLRDFLTAASENLLNIIPPECFTEAYVGIPSKMGTTHFICDPIYLRPMLKSRAFDFPKSRSLNALLDPLIPLSIFVTDGEKWREQHKTMIATFNRRHVLGFEPQIRLTIDNFLSRHNLSNGLSNANAQDITPTMQQLTFEIISQILLGTSRDPLLEQLRALFEEYLDDAARVKQLDLAYVKLSFFPNPRYFTHAKILTKFRNVAENLVAARCAQPAPESPDFLEYLIEAYQLRQHPTRNNLKEVRDNLVTFIIAGHETTAMTLSWALYTLSFYPEYQRKIAQEANNPLDHMPVTENYLKEVMRLYPPVPLIARRTSIREIIEGHPFKNREGILIPIIAIHRHEAFWDKPNIFIPERFANFEPKALTYIPFGDGPRICIGASFAMMEAKIALAQIMKHYQISNMGHIPEPHQALTLRSSNGIKLGITSHEKLDKPNEHH